MEKIVVAADSFKGSLTAVQACGAIAAGVRRALPDAEVIAVPVGDGGEGTMNALSGALRASEVPCRIHGPLKEPLEAFYAVTPDGNTAVIEVAAAAGLTLVSQERRNPLDTTSFGVGEMIGDALERGVRLFIVGLGGSATNDAGAGMLAALGFRFYDNAGKVINVPCGKDLEHIVRIDGSSVIPELAEASFVAACDVSNPLYGPDGAAYVFAPQKGASEADVEVLDSGLRSFSEAMISSGYEDVSQLPGAGAAGGLGGAFAGFLHADLKHGVDMVLDAVGFRQTIDGARLVITGEGRIDSQTLMGKTPAGVLAVASEKSIPVIAIGGSVEDGTELPGFAAVVQAMPAGMPVDEAMRPDVAVKNLENAAFRAVISHIEA
jgi:glycerate kinase